MALYWAFILDLLSPRKSIVFHYRVRLGHWSVNELLQSLCRVNLSGQSRLTRGERADNRRNKPEHGFALGFAIRGGWQWGRFEM